MVGCVEFCIHLYCTHRKRKRKSVSKNCFRLRFHVLLSPLLRTQKTRIMAYGHSTAFTHFHCIFSFYYSLKSVTSIIFIQTKMKSNLLGLTVVLQLGRQNFYCIFYQLRIILMCLKNIFLFTSHQQIYFMYARLTSEMLVMLYELYDMKHLINTMQRMNTIEKNACALLLTIHFVSHTDRSSP